MKFIKYIRYLLFPFSIIYGVVTYFRNLFFEYGVGSFKSKSFPIPIISVGNITVGGTGKTPHTEWIIRLLQDKYSIAVLSRGYKRKTKGLLVADAQSTAADIGDEPKQIQTKFPKVQVVVAEERVKGIEAILQLPNKHDVVLMDDAFQHRYVKPGFSILVMDYNRPFWRDCLLPAGELREFSSGKKRASIVVVSKCPADMPQKDQELFIRKLNLKSSQSVFFTTIAYQGICPAFADEIKTVDISDKKVLLVSGIAQPKLMFDYISGKALKTELLQFGDHHNFSDTDIINISDKLRSLGDDAIIVTTEKDAVRFADLLANDAPLRSKIYMLPIAIEVLNKQKVQLQDKILKYVRQD